MHLSSEQIIDLARPVVSTERYVSLAYLFGSSVTKDTSPLSDYDFAFYLTNEDSEQAISSKLVFETQSSLIYKLSLCLKTDKIDVVILNNTNLSPEIKFDVISNGILFYEKEPYKILIEPRIMNEYYDYKMFLKFNTL